MTTIKKKLTAIFAAVILLAAGIFAGGATLNREAKALSPYFPIYNENNGYPIYYFCDSAPEYVDEIYEVYGLNYYSPIYFDRHDLLTEQELKFMYYSGYFWGIQYQGYGKLLVVFEIKTMVPDATLLEDIFDCLRQQNCVVAFVTPYPEEYPFASDLYYFDISPCNQDKYQYFLDTSCYDMECFFGLPVSDLIFILDGAMTRPERSEPVPWETYIDIFSPTSRRMMLELYYGYVPENYEKDLFESMWSDYIGSTSLFEEADCSLTDDDYGEKTGDEMVRMWKKLEEYDLERWSYFLTEYRQSYRNRYLAAAKPYYRDILAGLRSRNVYFLVYSHDYKLANLTDASYLNSFISPTDGTFIDEDNTFENFTYIDITSTEAIDIYYELIIKVLNLQQDENQGENQYKSIDAEDALDVRMMSKEPPENGIKGFSTKLENGLKLHNALLIAQNSIPSNPLEPVIPNPDPDLPLKSFYMYTWSTTTISKDPDGITMKTFEDLVSEYGGYRENIEAGIEFMNSFEGLYLFYLTMETI